MKKREKISKSRNFPPPPQRFQPMPRESNFASCYRLHFLSDNSMAWGQTFTWTYCWKPTINDKPCSKPALKIIKTQPCIPWHFGLSLEKKHQPLAIPNSSKPWWLLGFGQCLGGRRKAEFNYLEFNPGKHWSKVTSSSVELFMCRLWYCPCRAICVGQWNDCRKARGLSTSHSSPHTAPNSSSLEVCTSWTGRKPGIILMETCFAVLFCFLNLTARCGAKSWNTMK